MANTFNAITTGTGGVATTGDSSGAFSFTKDGGSSELYLDASGNVGIGTSSPGNYGKFQVSNGTNQLAVGFLTNKPIITATNNAGSAYADLLFDGTTQQFYTGGGERMRIASDGTITGTKGNLQLISGTAVASTSGTAIDFTGIPSWVKRITIMFDGVSTNSTSAFLVQVGAGSVTTSGYTAYGANTTASAIGGTAYTAGFGIRYDTAASLMSGAMTITNITGNTWTSTHALVGSTTTNGYYGAGKIALGGTLDRVRITSVTPDTFDAGNINIMYE